MGLTRRAARGLGVAAILVSALLFATSAWAANPFLSAADDQPVGANFTGTQWGDAIAQGERPLSARVVTTRLAQLPFGAVFKIDFIEVADQGAPPRRLAPWHFLVTDGEIAVIKDENPGEVIARLKRLPKAPLVAQDIYAISRGSRTYKLDKLSVARLTVTGARCVYKWTHNAGHFTTLVWQRGVGLIELAQGRGARADGFRLVRAAPSLKAPGAASTHGPAPAAAASPVKAPGAALAHGAAPAAAASPGKAPDAASAHGSAPRRP